MASNDLRASVLPCFRRLSKQNGVGRVARMLQLVTASTLNITTTGTLLVEFGHTVEEDSELSLQGVHVSQE